MGVVTIIMLRLSVPHEFDMDVKLRRRVGRSK